MSIPCLSYLRHCASNFDFELSASTLILSATATVTATAAVNRIIPHSVNTIFVTSNEC